MNIKSFKLNTGEELVAQFLTATGEGFKIKNPLVVHMMRTAEGARLGFVQWSMVQAEDTEIVLFDHALAAKPVDVLQAVADSYIEQTSSLILPPAPSQQILMG